MLKLRKGMINITLAIFLIVLSSFVAIVLTSVMKEVLFVESVVQDSIESSLSRLAFQSASNVWMKFLDQNSQYWDTLHEPFKLDTNLQLPGAVELGELRAPATYTYLAIQFPLKTKLATTGPEKTVIYTVGSSTTAYDKQNLVMSVTMDIIKNSGTGQLQVINEGATFDYGWPSM